jgi:hypothetical protein
MEQSIYFSLNKPLSAEAIVKGIEHLINKNQPLNSDAVLEIKLKNISYTTNELIPKLEYIKAE